MKTDIDPELVVDEVDMPSELVLDWSKAKPNRFAALANAKPLTVAIDPDVAAVFPTPEAVNEVLRAIVHAIRIHGEDPTTTSQQP